MSKLIKFVTLYKYDYLIENVLSDDLKIKKNKLQYLEKDKYGNIIQEINFDDLGEFQDKHINKYNDKGLLIEEILYDEDDQIIESYFYNRDENGLLINKKIRYIDGSEDTELYNYDENDNLVEKILSDSDDYIERKEIFKYSDNKMISKEEYDEDNKLVSKITNVYDEDGRLIETTMWDEEQGNIKLVNKYNNKGFREKVFKYNDKGQLIEKNEYFEDDKKRIYQMIEETPFEKNIIKFSFDDKGNVVLQEEYNRDNVLVSSIERKYDEDNNVLETIVSVDGQGRALSQNYTLKYEYEFFDE
ncbi:MAG: hypothetical protein J7J86_10030 [Bacteroidales bacterium]|nr:hypothetical protein [Bacteroidales bacterium]